MSNDDKRPSWFQHALEQQSGRPQSQLVSTLALVVVVVVIIGALYLIQTTTTTTTARELDDLADKRARLESSNERMRAQIAQLQSLPRVMARAQELGFRDAKPDEIQYVIVDGYRYDRPRLMPVPTPTPEPAEQVYDDTLGGWARRQWDKFKKQFDDWRSG